MAQNVIVKSLNTAKKTKRNFDAVITIEDPNFRNGLRFHSAFHPPQLIMMFEDVDQKYDGVVCPRMEHVQASLEFARQFKDKSILVHCKAGIARSAAVALGIIADRYGDGLEDLAVNELLRVRPESVPNVILLDLVDEYLGRDGKLKAAWMNVEKTKSDYEKHRLLKESLFRRSPELFALENDGIHSKIYLVENGVSKKFSNVETNTRKPSGI